MDIKTIAIGYLTIALGVSWTSYLTIFRPAIHLLEEILEEKSRYRGIFGFTLWTLFATAAAPIFAVVLLRNDNEKFVEYFATELAEKEIEHEE